MADRRCIFNFVRKVSDIYFFTVNGRDEMVMCEVWLYIGFCLFWNLFYMNTSFNYLIYVKTQIQMNISLVVLYKYRFCHNICLCIDVVHDIAIFGEKQLQYFEESNTSIV